VLYLVSPEQVLIRDSAKECIVTIYTLYRLYTIYSELELQATCW
jgi:hypothetical protein